MEDLDESYRIPSISEIFEKDVPPEYIPIIVLSIIICIIIIVIFVRAVNAHRTHTTKHTMQALCTLGVLLVVPIFAVMYLSGIIVPKAMPKVTFIAETYEAISLLFFLRLILTFMGGKNATRAQLKNNHIQLNSPPLCCLVCLPHIKFSKTFFFINEIFILQLVVCQLVLGYVDLLIGLDESHDYPAALIEEQYSHYFHIFIIFSLLVAIYGLGGIYHSAEEQLAHYDIFWKFIIYKAFVTLVKIEELATAWITDAIEEKLKVLDYGAFKGHLRVHMWLYFVIMIEGLVTFPWLVRAYPVSDYPRSPSSYRKVPEEVEGGCGVADDNAGMAENGGGGTGGGETENRYESFPGSDLVEEAVGGGCGRVVEEAELMPQDGNGTVPLGDMDEGESESKTHETTHV